MAKAISTDPTAAVAAAAPVAAHKIAPGAGAAFAATVAAVAAPHAETAAQAPAPAPSVSVELSPAAHFLSTVAHAQEQLGQLEANAIDTPTLQRAVDTLAAQEAQPDAPAPLNANPALAAAIAAYRSNEHPATPGNTRAASSKRTLVTPVDAVQAEEALESETDASILKGQQHAPLR